MGFCCFRPSEETIPEQHSTLPLMFRQDMGGGYTSRKLIEEMLSSRFKDVVPNVEDFGIVVRGILIP
jgi:hypothetical protein